MPNVLFNPWVRWDTWPGLGREFFRRRRRRRRPPPDLLNMLNIIKKCFFGVQKSPCGHVVGDTELLGVFCVSEACIQASA